MGGKREGAGRKRHEADDRCVPMTVSVPSKLKARIEKMAADTRISVSRIVADYLKKMF